MATVSQKNPKATFTKFPILFLAILAISIPLQLISCTTSPAVNPEPEKKAPVDLENQWGVQLHGIRLTAAGYMVDFRYRVTDPDKAMALRQRGEKAILIDQASGTELPVTTFTKLGRMRSTGSKPQVDKVYPIMFTNIGRRIQQGSEVTVVIGEFRAENLVVE